MSKNKKKKTKKLLQEINEKINKLECEINEVKNKPEYHINIDKLDVQQLDNLIFRLDKLDIKDLSGALNIGNNFDIKKDKTDKEGIKEGNSKSKDKNQKKEKHRHRHRDKEKDGKTDETDCAAEFSNDLKSIRALFKEIIG